MNLRIHKSIIQKMGVITRSTHNTIGSSICAFGARNDGIIDLGLFPKKRGLIALPE
jgi:hypothetical protein